jgi:glucose-1-phosphate adenylyltransferase
MNNIMGIINVVENSYALNEITLHRPLATVPFGGRYRLIDFVLSGMVNSGIDNIGILAPYRHRSLFDHLRSGKDWNLARKRDGLTLLPPPDVQAQNLPECDMQNLYCNLEFLQRSQQEFVLVSSAGVVGNFDFAKPFQFHEESKADITLLYKKQQFGDEDCSNCILLGIGNDNRVTDIWIRPSQIDKTNFFLGMFILRKELLISLVKDCLTKGDVDCILRAISNNLSHLKVHAYHYQGYLARIHCLQSYYQHSMELLKPQIWRDLFFQPGKIYTKVKDEAPAKYIGHAKMTNALVSGGCSIKGTVEHSILFRRVTVGDGAHINNSILMANTEIGPQVYLDHVICDKDVRISAGTHLCGEKDRPLVLKKGTII